MDFIGHLFLALVNDCRRQVPFHDPKSESQMLGIEVLVSIFILTIEDPDEGRLLVVDLAEFVEPRFVELTLVWSAEKDEDVLSIL
jgi:hypothetical protein